MSRTKYIIPLLVIQAVYVLAAYLALDWFVASEFSKLEQQRAARDVARVQLAMVDQAVALKTRVKDWAPWDDTYNFVQSGDREFIHRNLSPETLENLNLDLIVFANRAGDVVWSHVAGRTELSDLNLSDLIDKAANADRPEISEGIHGVFKLSESALYLLAAHPVLTSERQGPSEGAVIFGWELSSFGIEKIRQPLSIDFDIKLVGSDAVDMELINSLPSSGLPLIVKDRAGRNYANALLKNVGNDAQVLLRVRAHQDITASGKLSIDLVLYWLGGISLVFAALLWLSAPVIAQRFWNHK